MTDERSCANCFENHVECSIMAILRDHLVEYYEDKPGHVEVPEDWEKARLEFTQWSCSRWRLDTPELCRQRIAEFENEIGHKVTDLGPQAFMDWRSGPCPICGAPWQEGSARLEHFLGHLFDKKQKAGYETCNCVGCM